MSLMISHLNICASHSGQVRQHGTAGRASFQAERDQEGTESFQTKHYQAIERGRSRL